MFVQQLLRRVPAISLQHLRPSLQPCSTIKHLDNIVFHRNYADGVKGIGESKWYITEIPDDFSHSVKAGAPYRNTRGSPNRTGKRHFDNNHRKLWLKVKDTEVSEKYISGLSEDILDVNIVRRPDICHVYVLFETEEIAEDHYDKFDEMGLRVQFCGNKLGDWKKPHRKFERPDWIYEDEKAPRKLRMMFPVRVEEEEIYALSDDIVNVKISWRDRDWQITSKVIAEFKTEEQAKNHFQWLKMVSIREWPADVHLCYSKKKDHQSKELIVRDVQEDETMDDLLELFKGAERGEFFTSFLNQRWAKLFFPDPETCVQSMEKYGYGRNIGIPVHKEKKTLEMNYKQLRLLLRSWDTKDGIKEVFPNSERIRFYNRLEKARNFIDRYAIVDYKDEELARKDLELNDDIENLSYGHNYDIDDETLVLNDISDWDDESSLNQLFPASVKIFIHRFVSDNGRVTLRNAYILFENNEDAAKALEEHKHRRLAYRMVLNP